MKARKSLALLAMPLMPLLIPNLLGGGLVLPLHDRSGLWRSVTDLDPLCLQIIERMFKVPCFKQVQVSPKK
jgi:hypothetical protein